MFQTWQQFKRLRYQPLSVRPQLEYTSCDGRGKYLNKVSQKITTAAIIYSKGNYNKNCSKQMMLLKDFAQGMGMLHFIRLAFKCHFSFIEFRYQTAIFLLLSFDAAAYLLDVYRS